MIRIHSTFAAFLLGTSVLAAVPALAASTIPVCTCRPAKPVAHHAVRPAIRKVVRADRAYVTAFYDYRAAAPVSRSFHAAWVEAPHDRRIVFVNSYPPPAAPLPPAPPPSPAYYGDAGYGYEGGYAAMDYNPDLNRGWSGGVGYMGAQDGGGGGGGGTAIIAGGQNQNGPTYSSYGQSFPYGGADTYAAQTNAYWRNTGIPIKQN